jgi:hypothetical protein
LLFQNKRTKKNIRQTHWIQHIKRIHTTKEKCEKDKQKFEQVNTSKQIGRVKFRVGKGFGKFLVVSYLLSKTTINSIHSTLSPH